MAAVTSGKRPDTTTMQKDRSKSLMQLRDSAKAAYGGKLAVAKNDVSTDGMVKHVPIDEDVVKTSVLGKIQKTGAVVDRQVYIAQRELVFSNIGASAVLDFILLSEIDVVKKLEGQSPGTGQLLDGIMTEETHHGFIVHTKKDGLYHGKLFEFRCKSASDRDDWIDAIEAQKAKMLLEGVCWPSFNRLQQKILVVVDSNLYQFFVIVAIVANFMCNVAEAQLNPITPDSEMERVFTIIDLVFIYLFLAELVINMVARWFWAFWSDRANWMDFFVVAVSLVGLFVSSGAGGGAFTVLRIMRVFRVVRVFKRLASVRLIISALASSVIPVSNAFFIMILATSIWAILGVNLFSEKAPHQFGNFGAAFLTMFQCVTGDSWASGIARPIIQQDIEDGDAEFELGVFTYFVSYMLIVSMVTVNVVLAVLLDEFLRAASSEKNAKAMTDLYERNGKILDQFETSIDPLLEDLTHVDSMDALHSRVEMIFRAMDIDGSGSLDYEELAQGLRKLSFHPPIDLSNEEFVELTDGVLPDPSGSLSKESFVQAMTQQMCKYMHRRADKSLVLKESGVDNAQDTTNLFLLKYITLLQMVKSDAGTSNDSYPVSPSRGISNGDSPVSRGIASDSYPVLPPRRFTRGNSPRGIARDAVEQPKSNGIDERVEDLVAKQAQIRNDLSRLENVVNTGFDKLQGLMNKMVVEFAQHRAETHAVNSSRGVRSEATPVNALYFAGSAKSGADTHAIDHRLTESRDYPPQRAPSNQSGASSMGNGAISIRTNAADLGRRTADLPAFYNVRPATPPDNAAAGSAVAFFTKQDDRSQQQNAKVSASVVESPYQYFGPDGVEEVFHDIRSRTAASPQINENGPSRRSRQDMPDRARRF